MRGHIYIIHPSNFPHACVLAESCTPPFCWSSLCVWFPKEALLRLPQIKGFTNCSSHVRLGEEALALLILWRSNIASTESSRTVISVSPANATVAHLHLLQTVPAHDFSSQKVSTCYEVCVVLHRLVRLMHDDPGYFYTWYGPTGLRSSTYTTI